MKTKELKNRVSFNGRLLDMSKDTYNLRREVMKVLYEVKKKGYNIPRVEVRIVSKDTDACAYAYLGKNIVHVNETYISDKYESLFTQIILHEVVHAVFGVGEVKNCKLMHCSQFWVNRPSEETAWRLFNKYYESYINHYKA